MAGGIDLAKAYVQIVPSAQNITGALEKVIGGEAGVAGEDAGKKMGDKLKSALKKAVAGFSIATAVKQSLDFGAELQQNLGGTEAVFEKYANEVQSKAKEAYKNMGLSASDYMATANKMGSLFQGSGLDQQKSLQLTTDAMQRAADVASVMGIDTQMAMESIAGAAKGNFTMMDNLGVAMNATTLAAYALEKGVNFDWNTASNAEKAELAMQMFMERTAQYEGNFARESEGTFSGALGAMKAAYQDFMANLMVGEDVIPAFQNLATTFSTFVTGNLLPALGRIVSSIPDLLSAGADMILSLATGWTHNIPVLILTGLKGLSSFSESLRANAGKFVDAGLMLIQRFVAGVVAAIPTFVAQAPQIISNFAGVINDNAPKLIKAGANIIRMLWEGVKSLVASIKDNWRSVLQALLDVWQAVNWMNLGKNIISNIKKGIGAAKEELPIFLKGIGENAKKFFKSIDWKSLGHAVITLIKGGLSALAHAIPNAIKTIATTAWNAFKGVDWIGLGKTVISFIVNGLVAFVTKVPSKLLEIGKAAVDKVKSIDWAQLGKDIINGIISGVKGIGSSLWTSIKNIATGAKNEAAAVDFSEVGRGWMDGVVKGIKSRVDKVKKQAADSGTEAYNALKWRTETSSPSRLFARMGGYWMDGLALGIERKIPVVTDALDDVNADIYNSIKPVAVSTAEVRGINGLAAKSTVININTTVDGAEDPEAFASRLVRQLQLDLRTI